MNVVGVSILLDSLSFEYPLHLCIYRVNITGPKTEFCGTALCSGIVAGVIFYMDTVGAVFQVRPEP